MWFAIRDRLVAFEASGARSIEAAAPAGLRSLAGAGNRLVATLEPGVVAWVSQESGDVLQRVPVGGEPAAVSGGGAVWVVDRRGGRAWRADSEGVLVGPVPLGPVDQVAPDGERIWWTSPRDTLLRGGDRSVDLAVPSGRRGGMVACANSIWIGVAGGLLRVGAWAADRAQPLEAPHGPVPFLVCAGGALVGGGSGGLFVLDPNVDAGVRELEVAFDGPLGLLIATGTRVWAVPAGRPEAEVIQVRPGG